MLRFLPLAAAFLVVLLVASPGAAEDGKVAPKGVPKKAAKVEPKKPPADPAVLTFQDVFGGGRAFTKPVPPWSWRPGHKQLVRLDMRKQIGEGGKAPPGMRRGMGEPPGKGTGGTGKKGNPKKPKLRPYLVVMDPETGATQDLFDFGSIDTFVLEKEKGPDGKWRKRKVQKMRGVGRAGPRRYYWSKSGKQICVVLRGDLVWVDFEKKTHRRLTYTQTPMADLNIAPDGSHVSFSRDNELWVVSTTEGKPRKLTSGGSDVLLNGTLDWVYPEELGFRTAAWWSPDSKHLAYLQMDQSKVPTHRLPATVHRRGEGRVMRYPRPGDPNPKVRVGVVPVGGGETRWVGLEAPPNVIGSSAWEYIVRVAWRAPDLLAVLTMPRDQRVLTMTTVDVSDAPRTVGRQHLDNARAMRFGSVSGRHREQYNHVPPGWLRPGPAPRFATPTEVETGDPARLPHGMVWAHGTAWRAWVRWDRSKKRSAEITALGADARSLLHLDPETGHCIYQGIPHGSATQGVFLGKPGVQGLPIRAPFARDPFLWTSARIDESGSYALVTTQSATTPPRTVLARMKDGEVLREIGDARGKALDDVRFAQPEYGRIPVHAEDPKTPLGYIRWRLWKPADFDPSKRYGLIVHVYGGPGSRMVRNTYGRGPKLPTLLGQKGFLVLQVDGRGTSGWTKDWLYCVQGKLGVLETEDQATAVQHILKRGYVDPARVGIWGWSYGGTMACNAMVMRPDVFKCGVAVASVTDWRMYDSIYTERYMGLPKDNKEGYAQSSAITHAKKLEGPLLLMHGMGDDNVHVQNTMQLAEAFLKHKKTTFDVKLYAKRGHGIGGAGHDVFRRMLDWFERHIGEDKRR